MSSHYINVSCDKCGRFGSIYTGGDIIDDFDDEDWEGETIHVAMCAPCKESVETIPSNNGLGGDNAPLSISPDNKVEE